MHVFSNAVIIAGEYKLEGTRCSGVFAGRSNTNLVVIPVGLSDLKIRARLVYSYHVYCRG